MSRAFLMVGPQQTLSTGCRAYRSALLRIVGKRLENYREES